MSKGTNDNGGPQSTAADSVVPTKKDLLLPAGFNVNSARDVYRELARLRELGKMAIERAERAEAHATIMAQRNSELQRQMNMPKPAKSRKLNTGARFLTGEEGLRL